MNSKLVAGLLALAALLGCVWFFLAGSRDSSARGRGGAVEALPPPAELEPASQTELAPSSTPVPAPAAALVETERAAVAGEAADPWRGELAGLSGRVVESDGRPLPGMRVALFEFEGSLLFDGSGLDGASLDGAAFDPQEPSLELEETVTDPEGRFLLGGARQQAFHGLGVDLGGPRATIRVIDQALSHRTRTDIGDVVLAPFGVLTGRVVDEHGAPVPGARVRAGPFPEEILQAHPEDIRADTHISVSRAAIGGAGHAILELPGWIGALIDRLPVPTTHSAADGTFRLEGVALAKIVGGVDLPGYVGTSFGPLDMSGGTKDLGALTLVRGRTVKGVVEDSGGDPVVGAQVFAGAELVPGVVALLQPAGTSDEEGRFELAGVAAEGQVVATARRSACEDWSTSVSARAEGVLIELQSTVRLTVNVRDEEGRPIPGADLRVTPLMPADARMGFTEVLAFLPRSPSPRGIFAEVEPGRYVTESLAAGRYQATVRAAGRAPALAEVDCRGSENEVTITCPRGRAVELTVLDAATKAPIAGARASVLRASSAGFTKLAVRETDASGRAVLGPLGDVTGTGTTGIGPFSDQPLLLVEHPRHGDHSAALDPGASPLVVELHAGGALEGRVHWGGAMPTRLYMLTLSYKEAKNFLELFHLPRFALTDLSGAFRCANLAPGKYEVTLTDRFLHQDPLGLMVAEYDPPTLYRGEVEIRDGETTELVIDLTPTGRGATARVVGRVRFDGRNLRGAEVQIRGNEDVRVVTDEQGRFETQPFSVMGMITIEVEGEVSVAGGEPRHMQLHEESLELEADAVHELDLDLYPLTIHAKVLADADGAPVAAAEVSAQLQQEGEKRWYGRSSGEATPSNGSGEVELLVLEPGEYSLSAEAKGFTRASGSVKVAEDGSSEPAVLRLSRAIVCSGHVQVATLGNGPASFSHLWVQGVDNPNSAGVQLEAPDYAFTLEGLSPGKYRAYLWLSGQRGEEVAFELGKEGERDLVLEFVPRKQE